MVRLAKHYLTREQFAIAKGMRLRGDTVHDIMAYFGENSARYYDAERDYPDVKPAPRETLPPPYSGKSVIEQDMPLAEQVKVLRHLIATRANEAGSVVLWISPELAAWVLTELNTNNRKKRPAKIKTFAQHMQNNTWFLSGATLQFGVNGVLLDGQNRLSACVLSGEWFKTHIVFNVDEEAFPIIDTGSVRNNNDTFRMAGVANPDLASATVRWIKIHEEGLDRGRTFDNDVLLEYYRSKINKDDLDQVVKKAKQIGNVLPSSNLAALLYLAKRRNARATSRFAEDCLQDARGGRVLIRKLAAMKKKQLGRLHEDVKNALIIQTLRAYLHNKKVTAGTLNWTESKDFPTFD